MTEEAGYEIDFLPVGTGDRSGDAICIRTRTEGDDEILVYDGGTLESGEALVQHIQMYYGTDRVNHVISSHPDNEHAAGLSIVLEKLKVGELWMHQPWNYSRRILGYFQNPELAPAGLASHLKETMSAAYALMLVAQRRGVPIREPFLGQRIGKFFVLSPDAEWYAKTLVPESENSPEYRDLSYIEIIKRIQRKAAGPAASAREERESALREDAETTAENESSVVLFGLFAGQGILLTGDAGVRALHRAIGVFEAASMSPADVLTLVQIPHHGSRDNVTPSLLDTLLGPEDRAHDDLVARVACASVSQDSTTHPCKAVVDAFTRRGVKVYLTQGRNLCYNQCIPTRQGWADAAALELSGKRN